MTYGARGRIGFINPTAVYDVIAKEFERLLPSDFLILVRSLTIRNLLPHEFEKAWTLYREAALVLVDCEADVIVAGGSPVITRQGPDGDRRLIAELREATGIPVTTLLTAELEAVQAFKAGKIILVSPFTDEINRQRAKFFAAHGIEVLAHEGLGITHNVEITKVSAEVPYAMAKRLLDKHAEAEAAVLTCPRWPVVEILEALEQATGRPAITPVQAMLWKSFDLMGVRVQVPGYARCGSTRTSSGSSTSTSEGSRNPGPGMSTA